MTMAVYKHLINAQRVNETKVFCSYFRLSKLLLERRKIVLKTATKKLKYIFAPRYCDIT